MKAEEIAEIIQLPEKFGETQPDDAEKLFKDRLRAVLNMRRNEVEERLREIYYLQNQADEKTYTSNEANVLYLDLIETRRNIDLALLLPETGGSGRALDVPGLHRGRRR